VAYLGVTKAFAMVRLLPMSDRDKDTEILALRHQITVLQRQLGDRKVRLQPSDQTSLLRRLPLLALCGMKLLVRPDTVLRWHRNLLARRHAIVSRPSGRAVRARYGPSASWCCGWRGRIRVGATGACKANCSSLDQMIFTVTWVSGVSLACSSKST
jgi:hypothetical protein